MIVLDTNVLSELMRSQLNICRDIVDFLFLSLTGEIS